MLLHQGLHAQRDACPRPRTAGIANARRASRTACHAVAACAAKHFPIEAPDPVEAIRLRMEQGGLTVRDRVSSSGQPSRVREVLNRKRDLTLGMIRRLHREPGIAAESLIGP